MAVDGLSNGVRFVIVSHSARRRSHLTLYVYVCIYI
jgi:hypothetical protein